MLATLRRASSRAVGFAILAAAITACGGGDSQTESSNERPSAVTVTGADGASVSYLPRAGHSRKTVTVRVSRDATGAPQIPADMTPIGSVYQFSPLGLAALGAEVSVPFDSRRTNGGRPVLLVSAPGQPWMEVPDATIVGSSMVAHVPQLSHAVVVTKTTSSREQEVKLSFTAPTPPLALEIDPSGTAPTLPSPNQDGLIEVRQPTTVSVRASYSLPGQCTGQATLQLIAANMRVNPDGSTTDSMSVLAERTLTNQTGSFTAQHAFVPGDKGHTFFAAMLMCTNPPTQPLSYHGGVAGPAIDVDIPATTAPQISQGPVDVSVVDGDAAAFQVAATGSNLSYRWERSNDGGATFTRIAGSASMISVVTSLGDNGSLWRVVVSNAGGSVTSSVARLSVSQKSIAPIVNSDPASQTVVEGETASFTVVATGTPAPSIQWQRRATASSDPNAGWANVSGGTGVTYTTGAAALSQTGSQYRAMVSNSAGTAYSAPATLTVQQRVVAPQVVQAPEPLTVLVGQFGAFAVNASGTSPLSYQWFKNGTAIVGANAAEVLVYADPADVGETYELTVQVSNAAGTVSSAPVAMTIAEVPGAGGVTTPIDAELGGVAESGSDVIVVIPPNALTADAVVSIKTEDPGAAGLPADFKPIGDVIDIGPASLFFATPASLTLPVPEDLPAGTVMALVAIAPEMESAQRVSSTRFEKRQAAPTVNVRRMALGMTGSGDRAVAAAVDIGSVECLGAQNMRGGGAVVSLVRARRFIAAAVPESSCTGNAGTPSTRKIPSNTIVACRESEFADESLGQNVLQSRHVHCGKNEAELGLLDDANGNYGRFKLEWRVGSDGAPKLQKTYRLKLRLTQIEAPATTPASGTLRLQVRPTIECSSQQFPGNCTHSAVSGTVSAGQGWSSEISVPVTFAWSGGSETWNEFIFSQIRLDYTLPAGGEPRTVYLSGIPRIRCDKELALNKGQGCIYPDAPAVMVMSVGDSRVRDAAEHIKEAQAAGAPGGLYFDGAGQAIASEGNALKRTRIKAAQNSNRDRSCKDADSLFNTRPINASASCQPGSISNCQCDEYPFAATWNGGYFAPSSTSVKRILGAQNEYGGSLLGSFYQSERVLDLSEYSGDDTTPYDFSKELRRDGDSFWVHIE